MNADRVVASFLGLNVNMYRNRREAWALGMDPEFGSCDQCDAYVPRDELVPYPEGNVCERCVSKAAY